MAFRYEKVTVHSIHSNTLRDAQKSCISMISRRDSRGFCELCSQKTPRGMLPVNSNMKKTSNSEKTVKTMDVRLKMCIM